MDLLSFFGIEILAMDLSTTSKHSYSSPVPVCDNMAQCLSHECRHLLPIKLMRLDQLAQMWCFKNCDTPLCSSCTLQRIPQWWEEKLFFNILFPCSLSLAFSIFFQNISPSSCFFQGHYPSLSFLYLSHGLHHFIVELDLYAVSYVE